MTLCIATSAIAAEGESPQKGKQIPTVTVQKTIKKPFSIFYEGTGSIEASRIAQLASPAEGPVIGCTVREGDTVKAKDILVSLGRNISTEAFMQSAFEDLKKEEAEARRVEQLVNSGAIPAEQRAIARANLQKARAQAAKLRESMEDFQIKAPWDGIVSKVLVRDGNFVGPRAPLVELYDPKSLILRFSVPESHVALVKEGMPVEFHLDAYKGTQLSAKVVRIYPELDRKTRTLTLEAATDTKLLLKPGMFVRLRAHLVNEADTLIIPAKAVWTSPQGEPFVLVVNDAVSAEKQSGSQGKNQEGGTGGGKTKEQEKTQQAGGQGDSQGSKPGSVERRVVSTGIVAGDDIEITAGLKPGEFVVTAGGEKLENGAQVRVASGTEKGKN